MSDQGRSSELDPGRSSEHHAVKRRADGSAGSDGSSRAQSHGVSHADLDQLTSLFRLLSDKTRLNILLLLAEGERNVTSLCNELQLPQPTVSHHLGLLRMNNIIGNRRAGKQVFYTLQDRVGIAQPDTIEINTDQFGVKIQARRA